MTRRLKILDFDTENRPGFYWYDGRTTDMLMTIAWGWMDEKEVHWDTIRSDVEEGLIPLPLERFTEALSHADVVTGHNIKRHDVPLLNAHCDREGLPRLEWPLIVDTMDFMQKTKGVSRSQANLSDLFRLVEDKTQVHIPTWERAATGDAVALTIVAKRCMQDVRQHRELYKELVWRAYL